VPAAMPPHKSAEGLAPPEHRLAMVRLATKGNRHFMVSDVEIRRAGRSYTIDTVRHFLATLRAPSTLFLMMGTDAFAELETWKDCDELVRQSSIVVHTRQPAGDEEPPRISLAALKRFGYIREDDHYVHPSGQTLSFVATTSFPVSATLIREKLHRQHSVRYLMPGDVVDYIQRHGLY
jgi:nicotinate-nucleotide adenylyltransferase